MHSTMTDRRAGCALDATQPTAVGACVGENSASQATGQDSGFAVGLTYLLTQGKRKHEGPHIVSLFCDIQPLWLIW